MVTTLNLQQRHHRNTEQLGKRVYKAMCALEESTTDNQVRRIIVLERCLLWDARERYGESAQTSHDTDAFAKCIRSAERITTLLQTIE